MGSVVVANNWPSTPERMSAMWKIKDWDVEDSRDNIHILGSSKKKGQDGKKIHELKFSQNEKGKLKRASVMPKGKIQKISSIKENVFNLKQDQ